MTDALHEAGHAVSAKLLGAVNVRIHLTPEDLSTRGWTEFDLDPSSPQLPRQGHRVDLRDTASSVFTPLSDEHDIATRTWVVTRSGGVGSLIGSHALGLSTTEAEVMADCEHDDRELEELLRSAPSTAAQQWIELRYRETWAMLLRHEEAILASARCSIEQDGPGVQTALDRARDASSARSRLITDADLTRAEGVASSIGFASWPDWRAHERLRFEEYKNYLSRSDS